MKKIITKSILPVIVTTSVVAGAIVTSRVIDNKNFASEISNQKTLSYTEKENIEEEKNTVVVQPEKEVSESTKKVEVAKEKSKHAVTVKQESQKEVEKAKNAVKEAEKALESAKTEQEKIEAQAKVEAAKEEVEEKVKQAEETVKEVEPEKTETESKTNSSIPNSTAPSIVENSSPSINSNTNNLETVKMAIENTRNAKNMTVVNHIENSTRKFNKETGEEYAVYNNALSLTEKAGTLYSYKVNTTKTISLFKENGISEWKMVFSGKRSIGVIELELIKKTHSVEATSEGSYNVKISYKDAKSWLMNYYGSYSSLSGEVTIAVKTSNGYVQSIKGTVGNREIDLVLSNVGSTTIPSRSSLGIDEDTINSLEEEYKAHYDCERENDYWVCGPNKHVNQHNF